MWKKSSVILEEGTIEIAPLAFMRGRTLNDAFIILDEAQNTTSEQMKMFLTRIGMRSKAVITGDVTQIDLPFGRSSGLIEAKKILGDIDGLAFCFFNENDVVRHHLVRLIIKHINSTLKMRCALKEADPMTNRQKTRLGIIFGGKSGEHEVSLISAAAVINALNPDEFEITAIGITKTGKLG